MNFALKVWKLLVAIKDGLALLLLLLFFAALYAALSTAPGPGQVRKGALLIDLSGVIVEEKTAIDPLSILLSRELPLREFRARDVTRALRLAAGDDRIKAVVLDMSGFLGGGMVHMQEIGKAIDAVRAAGKPVLAYAVAYVDDSILLAAHASEVWIDPLGAAFVTGPGGKQLYYGPLLERLKVTTHVFRVGTFKSAVEPWTLDGPSPASREAYTALYRTQWRIWQAEVARVRPKADIAGVTTDPAGWVARAGGDLALAARQAGLVDRIGSRTAFGERVAEIVGKDNSDQRPGSFAHTDFDAWIAANPESSSGKAIGVITVAGEIVDGHAGPGAAGDERIVGLLDDALDDDLAALVVRIDSPGGSLLAAERIREAIERFARKDIPVVVSMANVAASGGVWVSMPARRIFAEPASVTGSIGVFAILPTFERALADIGVKADGVGTTPLSGQPDLLSGLAPEVSAIIQGNVESSYRKFLALVGKSRGKSVEEVERFAEGRPWDGASARRFGLIDEFGGLDDALAWAAKAAGLEPGGWHARYLGEKAGGLAALLQGLPGSVMVRDSDSRDGVAMLARRQSALFARALADLQRLIARRGLQAYCLECPLLPAAPMLGAAEASAFAGIAALPAR